MGALSLPGLGRGFRIYRSFRINVAMPKDVFERLRKIRACQQLRAEGCREATALQAIGFSRAT